MESRHFTSTSPTYYTTLYPFQIFPQKGIKFIEFSEITILCGGNGSGKSTLLNVISEKIGLNRDSQFNKTELFEEYVEMTECELSIYDKIEKREVLDVSRIITSDDVFKHILSVRSRNEMVDFKRDVVRDQRAEYLSNPSSGPKGIDCDDTESIRKYREFAELTNRRNSFSQIVRNRKILNERTYSNGENGYRYFMDAIKPGGLYLLDEPENSLSVSNQLELVDYIQAMARFYKCQFIISTHSPFILSMPQATIYDMDSVPVCKKEWTKLESVRMYHDFFKLHEDEFQE